MAFILPFVPLIGTALGAGVSIYAQGQQAKAASSAADYNNGLAKAEARNKEMETAEAIRRQRANDRAQLGALRAQLADTGTVGTEGSPLMVLGETAGRMELGIADAARASSIQASAMRAQGTMGLWQAEQAQSAAGIGMIGTGLTALGSIGATYQEGKRLGLYTRTKTTS